MWAGPGTKAGEPDLQCDLLIRIASQFPPKWRNINSMFQKLPRGTQSCRGEAGFQRCPWRAGQPRAGPILHPSVCHTATDMYWGRITSLRALRFAVGRARQSRTVTTCGQPTGRPWPSTSQAQGRLAHSPGEQPAWDTRSTHTAAWRPGVLTQRGPGCREQLQEKVKRQGPGFLPQLQNGPQVSVVPVDLRNAGKSTQPLLGDGF